MIVFTMEVDDIFKKVLYNEIRTRDLIAKYSHLDLKTLRNKDGLTLLHITAGASKIKLASYLIKQGAEIDAKNISNQSPLHAAARHGHREMVILLLQAGADVNLLDNEGWTPLMRAIGRGYNSKKIQEKSWEVTKILLEAGANPYLKTNRGIQYLNYVHDSEDQREIRLLHLYRLIDERPDEQSRLYSVEKFLVKEDLYELLRREGDERFEDIQKLITPTNSNSVLESSEDKITLLHRASGFNKIETANLLIDNGALIDATDVNGKTPLHYAAQWDHDEMIVCLVERGSNVNPRDNNGFTPLHVAAVKGRLTATCTLIRLGADLSARTKNKNLLPYDLADPNNVGLRDMLNPPIYVESRGASQETFESLPAPSNIDPLMFDLTPSLPDVETPKISIPTDDLRYEAIVKRMNMTKMRHISDGGQPFDYEIIDICLVVNKKLWKLYFHECKTIEIKGHLKNERLLFHGSKPEVIDYIVSNGFDPRYGQPNGMFGAGIYFADHSSKSNQYTFDKNEGCAKHGKLYCTTCERKMILAQVALGKSLVSSDAVPNIHHAPLHHDSVTGIPGKNLTYPEYTIYRGEQAYPLYVIKYRIK